MLQVLEKAFAAHMTTQEWQDKIRQIVPSYGIKLNSEPAKVQEIWDYTAEYLGLPTPPQIDLASLSAPVATPQPATTDTTSASQKPVATSPPEALRVSRTGGNPIFTARVSRHVSSGRALPPPHKCKPPSADRRMAVVFSA